MTKRPLTNRLRVLRAERGFSQIDTARLAGMTKDRFWRIENGYLDPTDDERGVFARIFNVEPSAIFPSSPASQEVA